MLLERRVRKLAGFTLVELLVSITVLAVILLVSSQIFNGMRTVISRTSNQIAEFREARGAFETMTRRISQATLNSYDDLDPATATTASTGAASAYARASELRFISGDATTLIGSSGPTGTLPHPTQAIFFQAPLGYSNVSSQSSTSSTSSTNLVGLIQLLNTCGYFIEWNSDQSLRPAFLPASIPLRWRYRLMEMVEPTESLSIYNYTSGPDPAITTPPLQSKSWNYTGKEWFQNSLSLPLPSSNQTPTGTRPVHAIASNVVFVALLPMVAPRDAKAVAGGTPAPDGSSTDIAPHYLYDTSVKSGLVPDSRNQLPPLVRIVMIAAEEQSFARYQAAKGSADPSANLGLTNILTDASYDQRMKDIKQVTDALSAAKISYRVFSATVTLTPN